MTWARIDDQLHGHRKIKRAWKTRGALGLHLMALSYCAGHLTDGYVDEEFVEEKLPSKAERVKLVGALIEAGLWIAVEGGWRINDFLDYNPSRADVEERRRKEAERKALARAAKSQQSPRVVPLGRDTESHGESQGESALSRPGPSRPGPWEQHG